MKTAYHKEAIANARNPDLDALKEREKVANEKRAKENKQRRIAREKQQAEAMAEALERLEGWKRGSNNYGSFYRLPIALRLSNEGAIIETSHGARVNMEDAKNLLACLNRGADIIGTSIDGFTVRAVSKNSIQIGCHKIPMSEIKRVVAAG